MLNSSAKMRKATGEKARRSGKMEPASGMMEAGSNLMRPPSIMTEAASGAASGLFVIVGRFPLFYVRTAVRRASRKRRPLSFAAQL